MTKKLRTTNLPITRYELRTNKGFTLIELVVVIAVTAMLSSIAILYSRTGESQILLFRDQASVVSAILRAKSLSIQIYAAAAEKICGYGVHFDASDGSFRIFKDLGTNSCADADKRYSGTNEDVEMFALDAKLKFASLGLADILFIPPNPTTEIYPALAPGVDSALIVISRQNGSSQVSVKVSQSGQITTQ